MNRVKKIVTAGAVLMLALAAAAPVSGQQGAVSGTVVDPLGARVPNASVTLTGAGPSREAKSGGEGTFSFASVALKPIFRRASIASPSTSAPTPTWGLPSGAADR